MKASKRKSQEILLKVTAGEISSVPSAGLRLPLGLSFLLSQSLGLKPAPKPRGRVGAMDLARFMRQARGPFP